MQKTLFKEGEIGVFALGGLGEVGKNLYCVETQTEIIIIDSGLLFPDEQMLGIDYVVPDYTYLIENEEKIRGLFITHGHEDHIGGIPFLLKQVKIPRIFANGLSVGLIKNKLEEYRELKPNFYEFSENEIIKFKTLEVGFFRTSHSIPDSFGIMIKTSAGVIVHTGDFKFDFTPTTNKECDYQKIARIGQRGVLCLLSDSTNSELEDFTISERVVSQTIKDLFKNIKGRVIIATFSSNVHRIQQIVEASLETNRKIAVVGRSMEKNLAVGEEMGYIKAPKGTFISYKELNNYKKEELTIMCTGSQGEPLAALSRIASGAHKQITLIPGDTVIFSSSPIPGNVESVEKTINLLYKNGAEVITHSPFNDIHSSGHGGQDELKLMLKLLKPKYFMPIHGEYHMLKVHGQLAIDTGVKKENVFLLDNGQVLALSENNAYIAGKVHASNVFVDSTGIGNIGTQTIRDRKMLAEDGILACIFTISRDKKLLSQPSIVSKGFVFLKNNEQLIKGLQELATSTIKKSLESPKYNINSLKQDVTKVLSDEIFLKTKHEPIVIPVAMTI